MSKLLNDRVWYTQGSQNVAKLRSDTSEAQNVWRWNTTRSVTSGSLRNDVMLCMWMKSYGKGVFTLLRSHEWESPWVWQVQNINRWVLQKYSLRNLSPSISSLHHPYSLSTPLHSLACNHTLIMASCLHLSMESVSQLPSLSLLIFVFVSCKYIKYTEGKGRIRI